MFSIHYSLLPQIHRTKIQYLQKKHVKTTVLYKHHNVRKKTLKRKLLADNCVFLHKILNNEYVNIINGSE